MVPSVLLAQSPTSLPSFTGACAEDPSWVCTTVRDRTGSETWAAAAEWFVARPLTIVLIVVVAWVANRIARVLIKRTLDRLVDPDRLAARRLVRKATPALLQRTAEVGLRADARAQTLTTVFRSIATFVIWFLAFLAILTVLDIDMAPVVAVAGVIGVALGFGARDVVADFLAGTFLVVEDQFGVGDIVDLGDASGTVEEVTLRSTRVRDVHGTLWHVRNGQISRVANKSQAWARALLDLEVDGGTDYDHAASVIQDVADRLSADPGFAADIIDTPEVWGIETFTDGGYTIRLVIKTRPASQFRVMRELRIRLTDAFRDAGIVRAGAGRPELWVHAADRPPPPASEPSPEPLEVDPVIPEPPRSPAKGDPSEG